MAKKLIITADDFGLAEDINRGIIECYTQGAVTDISLLAVGEGFGHAVMCAERNNIRKIGVHLALTGYFKPASPAQSVSALVNRGGRFPGSYVGFLAGFSAGRVKSGEVYTEFKNQISKVKKNGFEITHLDSHHHIHTLGGVLKIMIKLMKEEGIDYARFPLERRGATMKLCDPLSLFRNRILSPACGLSGKLLDASAVKHNDFFIGHARAHRLRREDFFSAISNLKEGLTEFGCHPGYFTASVRRNYPSYRNCEEELKVLCEKSFIDGIKNRAIELVSY